MRYAVRTHGYSAYTNGCRCATCRQAKAEYTRDRRSTASQRRQTAEALGERYVVAGITHGYSGYQNSHCRCDVCCRARKGADFAQYRRRTAAT